MTTSRSKKPAKSRQNRPRKKPIPKNIRERCLSAMQKLRRIEEANDDGYVRCISCGKVMHWKEAQGGHFIPRAVRATELEPDNIWPQCPQCNGVRKGNPIPYRYNLVRKIGEERVKRLEYIRAAYYGDEEALSHLNAEDADSTLQSRKKTKTCYAEIYAGLKESLKDAERRIEGI